jgi:epoxyqueuosine reductase
VATRKTALRRTRYRGLIRNALVAAGNTRDGSLTKSIRRHLESPDPLIAEHAHWALAQLPA